MIELTWSPRAAADLEEIRDYIAVDSAVYADLTVRRLVAAVERLRQFPDLGPVVPERESIELREIITGGFASCIEGAPMAMTWRSSPWFAVLGSFRTLRRRLAAQQGDGADGVQRHDIRVMDRRRGSSPERHAILITRSTPS